jgi:hypothetical protein
VLLILLACNDYSLNSKDKLIPGIEPQVDADLNPGGGSPGGDTDTAEAPPQEDSGETETEQDTGMDPCLDSEFEYTEQVGARLIVLDSHPVVADYPGGGTENTELWLDSPREIRIASGNEEEGNASLGSYVPGDELVFRIDHLATGVSHYTGPGSRNSDGEVHSSISYQGGCLWKVDFHSISGDSSSLSGSLLITGPLELSGG